MKAGWAAVILLTLKLSLKTDAVVNVDKEDADEVEECCCCWWWWWCGGGDHEQQWQTSKCTMAHKASNTLWLPTFSSIAGIVVAVNYANYAMHELPRFQPSLQQCCSADRRLCPMDESYGSCYRIAQSHLISWICERLTGTRRSIPFLQLPSLDTCHQILRRVALFTDNHAK